MNLVEIMPVLFVQYIATSFNKTKAKHIFNSVIGHFFQSSDPKPSNL